MKPALILILLTGLIFSMPVRAAEDAAADAQLFRTKDFIPLRYEDVNLHLAVPDSLRTTNVDVVKLNLNRQP